MNGAPRVLREPPRWLRALSWCLPPRHREEFLGDLLEEYHRFVRPSRGAVASRLWLVRQASRSAVAGLANRALDAIRPAPYTEREHPSPRRPHMDIFAQDLGYSLRRLLRSPGFTLVAVLSLALGIGANTALFTVVNTIMLEGVQMHDPSTLVRIYTSESDGYPYSTSSYPDYLDVRDGTEVFEEVVAHEMFFAQSEVDGGEPMLVAGEVVSASYFGTLGVRPQLGRGFLPDEDRVPDAHPVVVLAHDYWQRAFGSDPGVIGRTVRILKRPFTIVGVAPPDFGGMWPGIMVDLWVPSMMTDHVTRAFGDSRLEDRGSRSVFLIARLRAGVTAAQAAEHVEALSRGLEEAHPETNERRRMTALPEKDVALHPFVDRALLPVAALLFSVVGLVLLIACTNLASFLLARGADRAREIAVRLALGARRFMLIRQLLTETTVLAILGGVGGLLLARWTIALVMTFQPPIPVPINIDLRLDARVFGFTMLISLGSGLLFGLLPALQSTRTDVAVTLRTEAGATGSRDRWSLRNALVVAQVGLSFVLLVGAGLFVRSLQKAQAIDPGFDTSEAAIVWPNFEMSGIDPGEGQLLWEDLTRRAAALPGVTGVTLVEWLPLGIGVQATGALPEGVAPPEERDAFDVDFTSVDHRYFDVMGIPILTGRPFAPTDVEDAEPVAVVSEAFVRRFWPGESGVGKTVASSGIDYRVVGVARDAKVRTLGEAPRPYLYVSQAQQYEPSMHLLIRGTAPDGELLARLRAMVREARPDLILLDDFTMGDHLAIPLYAPRMAAILLGVFGGLALLLSGIGLYGVVSYSVSRRTREVGIRMSLGADARDVVGMVVRGGLRLVLVGAVIGLALSGAVTWLLSRFLYGVDPLDVATFAAIPVILTGVAALAAFLPARRASRVNPVDALRTE